MNAKLGPLPESIGTIHAVVVSATADLPSELVTQWSESGGPLGTSLIMRMSDPNSLDVCFNRCRAEPLLRRLIYINLAIVIALSAVSCSARYIRHYLINYLAVFPNLSSAQRGKELFEGRYFIRAC